MSLTPEQTQKLVDERLPINGWVQHPDGSLTTVGAEVYGVNIVKQLDRKGGWDYHFESITPVPVAKAITHARGVTVRPPRR